MILQNIIFLIIPLGLQCAYMANQHTFSVKEPVISHYQTDILVPISSYNDPADYDALITEWNKMTAVRRYRRAVKKTNSKDLIDAASNIDISALQKRFMIDKQYENTMVTVPWTICLLGKLMVHSSLADFSLLNFRNETWKFTRIRSPESFRATLAQIANDAWKAFMDAHSGMNKIQLNMQQIPQHIRTARRLLKADISHQLLSHLLPKALRHVTRIGEECKAVSEKSSKAFENVHFLLMDVEQATFASKRGYDTEREKIHVEYNMTQIDLKEKEKQKKQLEEDVAEAKTLIQEARRDLSQALDKIPTGFIAIAQEFCYTMIDFVGAINSVIRGRRGSIAGSSTNEKDQTQEGFPVTETRSIIKQLGTFLKSIINELTNSKGLQPKKFSLWKLSIEFWSNRNQNVKDNEIKAHATQLFERAIDSITQIIASLEAGGDINNENKQQLTELLNEVEKLQIPQGSTTNRDSVTEIDAPKERATVSNAKFIVMVHQQNLRSFEREYKESHGHLRKLNNDITEDFMRLARLNITEIHFKDIIEVLKNAVRLIRQIKENWSHLNIFFTTITQEIAVTVSSVFGTFTDNATPMQTSSGYANDRTYVLSLMDKLGKQVVDESQLIFLLSKTYVDISNKYIMKKLAGLSRLMLTDNTKQREKELIQLENEQSETEEAIKTLIDKRKRIFQEQLDKQNQELKRLQKQYDEMDDDVEQVNEEDQELLNTNV